MLAERFVIEVPEVVTREVSADGTRKYLVRIAGGHEVETVYIPEEDRGTLCISSQVGCTLTCSFCHTGTQKLVRNLTAGEIVGQVMLARDDLNDWPKPGEGMGERPRLLSNIVLMGMGEPLYNFEAVRDAMKIAMDGEGISLSRRRITLSTSGVVPEIARTAEEIGCLLAVSFHATTDEVRDKLVPINKKWNIADTSRRAARISEAVELRTHHLRIRDAEGRERQRRRCPAAGEADPGHPGQDQPDPVQRMAGCALRTLRLVTGSRRSPTSSTRRATPPPSARRGARISWPPADSSSPPPNAPASRGPRSRRKRASSAGRSAPAPARRGRTT